jgi:hypothetical protein
MVGKIILSAFRSLLNIASVRNFPSSIDFDIKIQVKFSNQTPHFLINIKSKF